MTLITIGTITNTHGLKGAVTVKTDSDFKEERYKEGQVLYIAHHNESYPVTVATHTMKKHLDVLTFEEYDDINDMIKFKGSELQIKDSDRHPLNENEYYFSDLIGLEVFTDQKIGTVKMVRSYPQGEILVIERAGQKDALVPFRKEFIKTITKTSITVVKMEGLF